MNKINLMDHIVSLGADAEAIHDFSFTMLEQSFDGEVDLPDATSPFVFLLEASALNAAASMTYNEIKTRELYPSLNSSFENLYKHMSSQDLYGRFGTPARTNFTLVLLKEEVIRLAEPFGNIKKLTIPRDTKFTAAEYEFGIHYPIDIKVMPHGGIQCSYDGSNPSTASPLTYNLLTFEEISIQNHKAIKITIPVEQFSLETFKTPINIASSFVSDYSFENNFLHARVWFSGGNREWTECEISHNDELHDSNVPTVALKVFEGVLRVVVPQVYLSNRMITGELRVDIYNTLGKLDVILGGLKHESFGAQWLDIGGVTESKYISPLTSLTNMSIFSEDIVTGGTNALTFEDMRERVIMKSGTKPIAISREDLKEAMADKGYDVLLHKDNLTDRVYVATRDIPSPANGDTLSGIGCTILPWTFVMEELANSEFVYNNGTQITVRPNTLFKQEDGKISIVSRAEITELDNLDTIRLMLKVNTSKYLYNPYHVVMDTEDDIFEARPYYLESPEIKARYFEQENISVGVQISSEAVRITKTVNGFELVITTAATDSAAFIPDANMEVQLIAKPVGSTLKVYIKGTLILSNEGSRTWAFRLDSRFNINSRDEIAITTFNLYEEDILAHVFGLTHEMELLHIIRDLDIPDAVPSHLDDLVLGDYLVGRYVVATRERLIVNFGASLTGLHNRSRSYAGSGALLRASEDTYRTYDTDVYEVDNNGVLVFQDGELVVEFTEGERVKDPEGNDILEYAAGDIIYTDGAPTIIGGRKIHREVDMTFLDGKYRFVNDENSITYRNTVPRVMSDYITEDIASFSKNMLELTDLNFYPKKTFGTADVLTKGSEVIELDLEQSYAVDYYVDIISYEDIALRENIEMVTREVISKFIRGKTISTSDLTILLNNKLGGDIISLRVHGFGLDNKINTFTLTDEKCRTSVRKIIDPKSDGTLTLTDDITINFIQHST